MEFLSSLTLFNSNTPFLLEKRIKLLIEIDKVGSISKAAKNVPLSYKAAWDAVTSINNLCSQIVVEKETGGKGGGGAKLTEYGKNLVQTYEVVQNEHKKFLEKVTKMTDFKTGTLKSLKRVGMQISARNQMAGVVDYIDRGSVNSSIYVKLKSGNTIISIITNEAVESLNLEPKDEITLFFKSSSVLLSSDLELNLSARNQFQGVVEKITIGEINAEIVIDISRGDKIVSIITAKAVNALELKEKMKIKAIIKASDVMIGK